MTAVNRITGGITLGVTATHVETDASAPNLTPDTRANGTAARVARVPALRRGSIDRGYRRVGLQNQAVASALIY